MIFSFWSSCLLGLEGSTATSDSLSHFKFVHECILIQRVYWAIASLLHFYFKVYFFDKIWGWRNGLGSRAHTILAEDPGSLPTHIGQLTATCHSSSRGINSGLHRWLHCPHTSTYICNWKLFCFFETKSLQVAGCPKMHRDPSRITGLNHYKELFFKKEKNIRVFLRYELEVVLFYIVIYYP